MADFRLSSQADNDLGGIVIYTIENFGIEQARREIADLAVRASIARDLSGVGKRFREQGSLLPPAKRGHDGKPLMPRLPRNKNHHHT